MSRSFGNVEWKLSEADFFLEKILEARRLMEAEYFLSAFLSAARSVTFALQASINDLPGFTEWYQPHADALRRNELARWFMNARNAAQKEGVTFIRSAISRADGSKLFSRTDPFADGNSIYAFEHLFEEATGGTHRQHDDVAVDCRRYLTDIVRIIKDCFDCFGMDIDPQQYYTKENAQRLGKTAEDFEEELGLPRGWTNELSPERRFAALRRHAGEAEIDYFFEKYLST